LTVDERHATLFMGDNSNRGWGSSVRAFWHQSRTLSQYHIKVPKSRQAVENDPNQTLQATVGEAFFLMFFGVSAGFGFSMSFGKPHRA